MTQDQPLPPTPTPAPAPSNPTVPSPIQPAAPPEEWSRAPLRLGRSAAAPGEAPTVAGPALARPEQRGALPVPYNPRYLGLRLTVYRLMVMGAVLVAHGFTLYYYASGRFSRTLADLSIGYWLGFAFTLVTAGLLFCRPTLARLTAVGLAYGSSLWGLQHYLGFWIWVSMNPRMFGRFPADAMTDTILETTFSVLGAVCGLRLIWHEVARLRARRGLPVPALWLRQSPPAYVDSAKGSTVPYRRRQEWLGTVALLAAPIVAKMAVQGATYIDWLGQHPPWSKNYDILVEMACELGMYQLVLFPGLFGPWRIWRLLAYGEVVREGYIQLHRWLEWIFTTSRAVNDTFLWTGWADPYSGATTVWLLLWSLLVVVGSVVAVRRLALELRALGAIATVAEVEEDRVTPGWDEAHQPGRIRNPR